jgi:hypothetical protein
MMDSLEAIKGLDGYTEILVSLSALLGAKIFDEKGSEHEGLLAQIKEKQTEGRWIALEIMKDIHHVGTKADRSGDVTGISTAIQRYLVADKQATEALKENNEALKKKDKVTAPNSVSEALHNFRKKAGLISD